MKEAIEKLAHQFKITQNSLGKLQKLHGDASNRLYFRAQFDDGMTIIVMQLPQGAASVSEEMTNLQGEARELPFLDVARFLNSCGLPTPHIYGYAKDEGVVLLEDLGDKMMAHVVTDASPEVQRIWYLKAIDLLVKVQQATHGMASEKCIALQRSFDETLFNWEFDHFLEYGLNARNILLSSEEVKTFLLETRAITEELMSFPASFVHRDFQSRNLMVKGDDLVLIDFQDALRGPSIYDLVALTRDSYVELSSSLLEALIAHYAEKTGRPLELVTEEFHFMTVQRKLKDAGRFVYIDRVKGNPHFLPYIPTSIRYVRDALAKIPSHEALAKVLQKHLPEWNT